MSGHDATENPGASRSEKFTPPFRACDKSAPYVFVSYAHKDRQRVYEDMLELHTRGWRIWYDEGIPPASDFPAEIAEAIEGCALFLVFISTRSLSSRYVKREISFAAKLENEIPILLIYLENIKLPSKFEFMIGDNQAILQYELADDYYYGQLSKALELYAKEAKGAPATLPEAAQKPVKPTARKRRHTKPTPATEKTHEEAANTLTLTLAPGVEMEFVRVPAGEFLMGSDKTKDPMASNYELPQHTVFLDEYYIGKHPVTNRQYQVFLKEEQYITPQHWKGDEIPDGKENHPVVFVSLEDAELFCEWLSKKSSMTFHLPSEALWEKAARGTDGRIYPWGNTQPDKNLCNFNWNEGGTTEVGKYSPQGDSPYGCVDMAGNVSEWVSDGMDLEYYSKSPYQNPQCPESRLWFIHRGGSFNEPDSGIRCAIRNGIAPADGDWYYGFRVANIPSFESKVGGYYTLLQMKHKPAQPIDNGSPLLKNSPPRNNKTHSETLTLTLAPGVEMEFVRVPAGEFRMGSDKTKDPLASDDELPQHTVYLDEYYIGKYPLTNRQYQAFVQVSGSAAPRYWQGGAIPAGKEKHPVVNVSWEDATAFCAWASERTGKTVHLPSEAQWEKAARGTDGRIFPWGDEKPNKNLCNYDSNEGGTTEVGKYSLQGDSPYGCADVAGNVWEWVNDWYGKDYYTASPPANPPGPASGNCRVLRGGSFVIGDWLARCALRLRYAPNVRSWNIGVRVVVLPFF